jgi:NADH:ubiquinone oxidoreductase subunit
MDTGGGAPQAVSGKQNLTHQILWFREALKNRESSGRRISTQKYFLRFFITASRQAWDALWISESANPATLAPVGAEAPRPYSPANLSRVVEPAMPFLKMIFSWWNSATFGTLLTTWTQGAAVGQDAFGNRYYQNKDGSRRWVLYNGTVEASRVPAEWHGWLHHTFAEPPTKAPLRTQVWEAPHQPNLTGTEYALRPEGSLQRSGHRPPATGDYQAWKPE